jgi:excisionase family DNA binding protein
MREAIPSHPAPAARGYTTAELAKLLRVGPDRIRAWIKSGELPAIDTAPPRSRKPRFIVLPVHLEHFERRHRAATISAKPARRRRQTSGVDFFPGD